MAKRLLVVTDALGRGDRELGRILMKSFLYATARNAEKPEAVLLLNEGVRLSCAGSDSLDDLRLLADAGVSVKSCGTCLDYLGLKDSLEVGEVGTMTGLVEALMGQDEIVTVG